MSYAMLVIVKSSLNLNVISRMKHLLKFRKRNNLEPCQLWLIPDQNRKSSDPTIIFSFVPSSFLLSPLNTNTKIFLLKSPVNIILCSFFPSSLSLNSNPFTEISCEYTLFLHLSLSLSLQILLLKSPVNIS